MIERIDENEKRFDNISLVISKLEKELDNFYSKKKTLDLLNNYYGSSEWFLDKELYESGSIPPIKAGVLSEDAIWNLNDKIDELMDKMQFIINEFKNK